MSRITILLIGKNKGKSTLVRTLQGNPLPPNQTLFLQKLTLEQLIDQQNHVIQVWDSCICFDKLRSSMINIQKQFFRRSTQSFCLKISKDVPSEKKTQIKVTPSSAIPFMKLKNTPSIESIRIDAKHQKQEICVELDCRQETQVKQVLSRGVQIARGKFYKNEVQCCVIF